MPLLLAFLLAVAIAGSAHAQYWTAYPTRPPIYLSTPGHPAEDAPDAAPAPGAVRSRGAEPRNGTMAQQMLAAHDAVRARVGDPPLAWSERLAAAAQDWADHLIATGQFRHRPGNRYGENLYAITGGVASPRQVVAAWAGEARGYDIRTNGCSGICGHYTQIVWRATRSVGCAVSSGAGRQVWVCEYDPPGNVVGYRPY